MRHCVKEVDSLFHPKVRWGEDSIFDAPAGISGEARPAGGVEGVYGFHQANVPMEIKSSCSEGRA